ncbi:MAG: hypothetical protein GY904_12875 [Planctomycetaceae bacterium]|nr:hypothetical protein [Planctomycetaceae bacterium]
MSQTRRIVLPFLLCAAGVAGLHRCSAQDPLPTVVQLPTFQFFNFSGSVLVPDGGGMYLGGNKTSAIGSSRRGLNRSFGQSQGGSQATAHVQIIDLSEMDRQLLGGTPEEFLRRHRNSSTLGNSSTLANSSTLDRTSNPDAEGKALVRHARKLYQRGDETGAFDTYRMAIAVLRSSRLQELAKIEFRRVFGAAADQSLRSVSLRR